MAVTAAFSRMVCCDAPCRDGSFIGTIGLGCSVRSDVPIEEQPRSALRDLVRRLDTSITAVHQESIMTRGRSSDSARFLWPMSRRRRLPALALALSVAVYAGMGAWLAISQPASASPVENRPQPHRTGGCYD